MKRWHKVVAISVLGIFIGSYAIATDTLGIFPRDKHGAVSPYFTPNINNLWQKRAEYSAPFMNLSTNTSTMKATAMQVSCFKHYTAGAQLKKSTADCTMLINGNYAVEIYAGETYTFGIEDDWKYVQFRTNVDPTPDRIKARVFLQK
jgi:hypothetical protein